MNSTLIIFDCDGVLIDSELLGCRIWVDCIAPYAPMTMKDILGLTGRPGPDICQTIEKQFNCKLPENILDDINLVVESRMEKELLPVKGVCETLPLLKNKMCIASGSRTERLDLSVRVTHMEAFFNHSNMFSSSLVKHGKPAPDIFLYAAEKMGFEPKNCIVIEDSRSGIIGAKAAGMTAFGFTGASHVTPERCIELKQVGADLLFDDFTKLPKLIENL